MKASLFFLFYFLAASATAAVISYPIYQIADIEAFDFERWVTRFALLFLVIGIFPCKKYFNINFSTIGYNCSPYKFLTKLSIGFICGLGVLLIVISFLLIFDIRTFKSGWAISGSLIYKSLFSGLIIALIEETLFRGLFFSIALRLHNAVTAIFISSFFYATLHFIKPYTHIDSNSLGILSGFEVIINAFAGLAQVQLDDWLALFAVGALLALVRFKTNTIVYCIGLHASWVLLIKVTKKVTAENHTSDLSFFIGHYDGVIGWLAFAWLVLVSITFFLITRNNSH